MDFTETVPELALAGVAADADVELLLEELLLPQAPRPIAISGMLASVRMELRLRFIGCPSLPSGPQALTLIAIPAAGTARAGARATRRGAAGCAGPTAGGASRLRTPDRRGRRARARRARARVAGAATGRQADRERDDAGGGENQTMYAGHRVSFTLNLMSSFL